MFLDVPVRWFTSNPISKELLPSPVFYHIANKQNNMHPDLDISISMHLMLIFFWITSFQKLDQRVTSTFIY